MPAARRTHCSRGHAMVPSNIIYRKSGRGCLECHRMHNRKSSRGGCELLPDRSARIPAERVVPLIDAWLLKHGDLEGLGAAAKKTVSRARAGEVFALATVDRLLVALDRVDAWYVELADVYFAEAVA